MSAKAKHAVRCAIYTRVSTDQGLEQDFNSLDAQHDASQAYIRSQAHAGWTLVRNKYDDGGFSGGNTERPALQRLLGDIRSGKIDVIVVYKVDRLTRSLADFAKLVELFDQHNVSFVSVTQQFNTTTSMGRLTLNVLLSFAQFEREVTSERIRDKIAASKRKGLWVGGNLPLGYALRRRLNIDDKRDDDDLIRRAVERVDVGKDQLVVSLKRNASPKTTSKISISWKKPPSKRRREILLPSNTTTNASYRPIRSDARERLIAAISQGRSWLDELVSGTSKDVTDIAARERRSVRWVNKRISLAFLAPSLVKAALDGKLPRGISHARLCDLPPEWSRQYRALGLSPPN